ncbi:penicillin-binding protein PbpA [Gordonia hirsuta DSM 44140 = NBRC 16056]|uniref:Penicillin-binding protein PbpA n=1 Tax=Gordonia hirsuta DSM 44140 = NBRC 16056 TaxID=1121927 RepID=L7L983_9ACTN|nr:penicillin-binding transpeptidase domain-containing protein [Gordonia hirsuta]GAC57710.1 penicillin-binding protein PbpA [Gordonia hirsuta DSM 44140 = NBRC 16056]
MNRPIQRVGMAVIVLVLLLVANLTWVQVLHAPALRASEYNKRSQIDTYSRQRGLILDAEGNVLAETVPSTGQFKYQRRYPAQPVQAYATVTGYYGPHFGAGYGIESAENAFLNGTDDRLFTQNFVDMFAGRDPRGGNVQTTIVPGLQTAAYDALRGGSCNGPCRGAVVAMEPSTGKILAMVSTPSYDPNLMATEDYTAAEASWNRLKTEPSPLRNRAISELYRPGSTFKVVTAATALRAGLKSDVRLTSAATFPLPGSSNSLPNDGNPPRACPGASGGTVTLAQAFEYSCNTAFAQLVTQKLPGDPFDEFTDTALGFGVGENPPGIPLSVAKSAIGDLDGDRAALAQSSIGERDVKLTVLQNAVNAATVAAGGVRMRPYLVDRLQSADLGTVAATTPSELNRPLTAEDAAVLTRMMVASEQSGRDAQAGIASKTGTTDPNETGSAYAWYIAFRPGANIAVAVMVENGTGGSQAYGGLIAAPIGRTVLNASTGGNR